jgi:quercetin dioxygenase-like cupin family protein
MRTSSPTSAIRIALFGSFANREKLMRIAVTGLIVFALGLPAALRADQMPAVTITPLLSTTTTASGQPIDVPAHPEVVVSRYEIAPNASLSMHKHPYPRYVYVLSGTLEIAVIGGKTYRYKAGDFIAEVIGQWHTGRNIGDTPVQLLVIDQVAPGHSNTVLRSEKAAGAASAGH